MQICFPVKIKRLSDNDADIGADFITANNFFAHFVKEIIVKK